MVKIELLHVIKNNIYISFSESVFNLLEEDETLVTYEDHRRWTPLHYAAFYKFDSVLEMIVEKQRRAKYQFVANKDVFAETPLIVAVREGHTSTAMEFLKLLPPSSFTNATSGGQNILHIMASQSNKEMIHSFLRFSPSGIDTILNAEDRDMNTPLRILVRQGCYVPEFIKDVRVDKTRKNKDYRTPLEMIYFNDKITDDQVRTRAPFGS